MILLEEFLNEIEIDDMRLTDEQFNYIINQRKNERIFSDPTNIEFFRDVFVHGVKGREAAEKAGKFPNNSTRLLSRFKEILTEILKEKGTSIQCVFVLDDDLQILNDIQQKVFRK